MITLFVGTQEIIALLLYLIALIGIAVLLLYVVYRTVDGWVNKSIKARREHNALLARLINTLDNRNKST